MATKKKVRKLTPSQVKEQQILNLVYDGLDAYSDNAEDTLEDIGMRPWMDIIDEFVDGTGSVSRRDFSQARLARVMKDPRVQRRFQMIVSYIFSNLRRAVVLQEED